MHCDGQLDLADINPFVRILTDEAAWHAGYPRCYRLNADCDSSGSIGFDDINGFVALLTQ